MSKIKALCARDTNQPLDVLLHQLNRMLRGWTAYFKYGCSSVAFNYLWAYLWKQVIRSQASADPLETIAPSLWPVARHGWGDAVRSDQGAHPALPVSGNANPDAVAERSMR
jgi:hypothetical protein